jgi:LAO/AO transport system kinase
MLSTAGGRVARQPPPVMVTTATSGDGVAALADAIESHRATAREPMAARGRAEHQIRRALADLAARSAAGRADWDQAVDAVAGRQLDPLTAAERLLSR